MKTHIKRYAGVLLASAVVITGIASAAIVPIPTISNSFAVSGQVIKSSDMNLLAQAINILDLRTNGMTPTEANHLADKEYVDGKISAISLTPGPQGPQGPVGATGPAGPSGPVDNLGNHTATAALNMSSNLINNVANPTAAQDAATKSYVDSAVAAAGGGGGLGVHFKLTVATYTGNLGGIAGADAKCAAEYGAGWVIFDDRASGHRNSQQRGLGQPEGVTSGKGWAVSIGGGACNNFTDGSASYGASLYTVINTPLFGAGSVWCDSVNSIVCTNIPR